MQPRWSAPVLPWLLIFFIWHPCFSQRADTITAASPGVVHRWSISINPFSWLELQSAAGIGVGYRLNDQVEVWVESSLLFPGIYYQNYPHLKGTREVLQLKYDFGAQKNWFIGLDARWKYYSYNDSFNFYNPSTRDTLRNFGYRLEHPIVGGALIIGQRTRISKNNHFFLETTIGGGFKYRYMTWKGVPPGYVHTQVFEKIDTMPFTAGPHTPGLLLYMPMALRFYYVF